MALKGVARFYKDTKKHIITCQTDHKCVLDSGRALQQEGFDVTYLPVQSNGLVDLERLKARARKAGLRSLVAADACHCLRTTHTSCK